MPGESLPFPAAVKCGFDQVPPADHNWIRITPSAEPALEFGMILPLGWGMEPDPAERPQYPGHLVRLALLGEVRESQGAVVQVSYTRVECDLHLYDWMQFNAKSFSMQPLNWRVNRGPTGREIVEMLALTGPPEDRYIARTVCLADSGFIVILLTMVTEARYGELADDFALITGSFALARPANPGQLEQWASAAATSPDFTMLHPVSWQARIPEVSVPGKSGIEVLLSTDDDIAGYVRIKAIDPKIVTDDLPRTFQLAFEELAEAGIRIESPWLDDAEPLYVEIPGEVAGKKAVGRLAKGPLDLRVAVVQRGGLIFCGTLLSAGVDAPAEWMRAKFAFVLALASANPK